jgi:hypothetical protein
MRIAQDNVPDAQTPPGAPRLGSGEHLLDQRVDHVGGVAGIRHDAK